MDSANTRAKKALLRLMSDTSNIPDSEAFLEKATNYAAEDADITYRLYKKFYKSLKDEKMINVY